MKSCQLDASIIRSRVLIGWGCDRAGPIRAEKPQRDGDADAGERGGSARLAEEHRQTDKHRRRAGWAGGGGG